MHDLWLQILPRVGDETLSPRRRSNDKVVPITIGLPTSLMIRLNNKLDYTQSRSLWVQSAIKQKLDKKINFDAVESKFLIGMLQARGIISYAMANDLLEKC